MTALRLGTYYRRETLDLLGLRPPPGASVLDIGCHDGAIIDDGDRGGGGGGGASGGGGGGPEDANAAARGIRVGVDLRPAPGRPIHYVRADGAALPFRRESFDWVLALEVVEHAADPRGLVEAGIEALRPGGTMVISAPDRDLRLFPSGMTAFMHERWGHGRDFSGLCEGDLLDLLPGEVRSSARLLRWRGGAYLRGYWMLRLAWDLAPPLARRWTRDAAARDARATSRATGRATGRANGRATGRANENGNYLIFAVIRRP